MKTFALHIRIIAGCLLITQLGFGQDKNPAITKKSTAPVMKAQEKNNPVGFTKGYSEVNGLKMYYEIYGKGKPLVLIHGGGSTIQTTFGRVLETFARNHQVIAVELQAHGRTADRGKPTSFEQDADDVAALLKNLNIDKADIFGFSNGGTTALQMAIRHPQMVDKLVVASAIYKKAGAPPFLWDVIRKGTFSDMPQEFKDAYLAVNPSKEGLLQMFKRDQARMNDFKDIPDSSIAAIKAKTLIVIGDKDVTTPEHAEEMHRLITNSSLMIIPGGHGDYIGEITTLTQGNGSYHQAVPLIERFLEEGNGLE